MAAYAAGDFPTAYRIWAAQANGGSFAAQVNAAEMLRLGRGVEADPEAARRMLLRAAERGYPVAQYMLGLHHHLGIGSAADIETAAAWYRRAAEQGHGRAALLLGQILELGLIGERDDNAALRWYGLAADKDEPDAMLALASLHLGGRGTRANADEAVRLLRQAADSGHPAAMHVLGVMSASGVGLMADNAIAARWLADAAAAGVPEARLRLGALRAAGVAAPAASRPGSIVANSYIVDASTVAWRPERRNPEGGRREPAQAGNARREGGPGAADDRAPARADVTSGPIDAPEFARGEDRQGRSFFDRVRSLVERAEHSRPSASGAATIPLPPVAAPSSKPIAEPNAPIPSATASSPPAASPPIAERASDARAQQAALTRLPAAAPAPPPPQAGETAGWRVRLAAYRSADAARDGWTELQRRHPDILTGLDVAVARVEILGKGTYFRVEAGPLRTRDAANSICKQLSSRGTDCVAVMGQRPS
ncbi:MAG: SEL1-like repeat protein [Alphaproteobacteria bacterium]|nr:SEL1-like repeat protein [Alphaproteobacteria bacterium]